MNNSLLILIVIILSVSLISSLFLLLYVFNKKKNNELKDEFSTPASSHADYNKPSCSRGWLYTFIFWPLFCLVLSGVILYLSFQKIPYRYSGDIILIFISMIFFFIGMGLLYKPINRKLQATNSAIATVTNIERSKGYRSRSSQRNYTSEYQFYVEGSMHKASSQFTCSTCPIGKGQEIKLFYDPLQPHMIYVPEEVKERCFTARILCVIGIICPLIIIVAPWIRAILE